VKTGDLVRPPSRFEIGSEINMRHGARTGPREDQDAYGQIYLAVLEGRDAQEIMERDDGLIYSSDPADYLAPYRRWPATERRAMRAVRGRVLDVGCGAGRVSLYLQERGHDVTAIDESPLAVEVARRRGVRNASARSAGDIDSSLGTFDTIVLLRNNFGLIGREGSASRLLRRFAAVTSEQGRIVTDSVDPERVANPAFREYRGHRHAAVRPHAQRYRVRWQRWATPWFYYLMFSPADMERLVAGTPWRVRRFIDDGSPRFVAVLEKRHREAPPGTVPLTV
jgi:SAM-dependent methyltransferase